MKKIIPKQNYSVVKHNDLVEARYKLTLQEQKLVLTVAMMIKPDDIDFYEYRLSVREFMALMEVDGNGYHGRVRQKAEALLKKPLVIPQQDGGELLCNWFAVIHYQKRAEQITLSFHPALKPYLLQLKNDFTEYKINNILKLQSGFSIRLYELLKQYLKIGERTIELEDFKRMLGIENKYKAYADIKRRVIDTAQRELSKSTDITFTYTPIKTGRKVTSLRFKITLKKESGTSIFQQFVDSVKPHGIDVKLVKATIAKYGIGGAVEIRDYALFRIKAGQDGNGKPIHTPSAYLAECFRNGHGCRSEQERERERRQAKNRRVAKRKAQIEARQKEIEITFDQHKDELLKAAKAVLPASKLEGLELEFQEEIKSGKYGSFLKNGFELKGKNAGAYKPLLNGFLRDRLVPETNIADFSPEYRELMEELIALKG